MKANYEWTKKSDDATSGATIRDATKDVTKNL